MSGDRGPTSSSSSAVGLHLLPSELLHSILLLLSLPDLLRLRSLSRFLHSLVSGPDFRQFYRSTPWLFLFTKRPPRGSLLRGFDPRSGRWFRFPVSGLIGPAVPPGEDLYLLAASGDLLLFASNGLRQLIAVDLTAKTVKKIPASPLGPRGTSSWRRSGLKLVADSSAGVFRFLFAELHQNRPVLFEYRSDTDTWRSVEADEAGRRPPRVGLCLNVVQFGNESVVLCADGPVVYRPRFREGHVENSHRLHVYGGGNMAVVRSTAVIANGARMMMVRGVELWGLSREGREWELVSRVGRELVEVVGKPYGVMMGCLEEATAAGVVRLVLVSNCRGAWDLTWLNYDRGKGEWEWVPVPDCGTHGLNMAGVAISSSFVGFKP